MYCPIRGTPGGKFGGALLVDGTDDIRDGDVMDAAVDVDDVVVVPVDSKAVLVADGRFKDEATVVTDVLERSY
uniref:Uncharacterized protein n=1 Tax=Arion vulgaris TaxID=1028688 RepID=A0A0B7BFZ0_9EUPU